MIKAKHIYRLMMLCLAALLLPACSSDNDLPETGGPEEVKGERYLHVTIQAPAKQSRTQVPDTPDTEEESNISYARFFLVDSQKKVHELNPVFMTPTGSASTDDPGGRYNSWEGRTLIPKDITPGDYYLYVVANPDMITPNTSNLTSFVGEYSAPYDQLSLAWKPNHFMMANTTNNININATHDTHGGRLITIPADSDAEVELSIERLAVKVEVDCSQIDKSKVINSTVYTDNSAVTYTVSDVTINRTTLLNCVTRYYLIQQWLGSGSPGTHAGTETAWLLTPSSFIDYTMIDVNYYNRLQEGDTPGLTLAGITEGTWIHPNASPKQFMYCMENNPPSYYTRSYGNPVPSIPTKAKGRATAVLIEAQIKVNDLPAGHNGTLYGYDGKLYADVDALPAGATGYQTYVGGKMYYTVWLKDDRYQALPEFGTDEEKNTPYFYYAVFRNSWNVLTINSISGWGMDDPDQPPTDPIDNEKIGLETEVRVNFWAIEHTEHTLGPDNVAGN